MPRRRHSRTHRNPGVHYVMAPVAKNTRRSHRVRRNPDWMREVVVPVLGGTAGFVAARVLGHALANQSLPVLAGNPNAGKLAAAVVGIPAAYMLSRKVDVVRENLGAIVLGMGMAPVEGYIRGLPLLGGQGPMIAMPSMPSTPAAPSSPQSPNVVPSGTSGLADYYTAGMLGTGMDISHAGAPYKGMLGIDGDFSGESATDGALDRAETHGGSIPAISTVTPTDVAAPMSMEPYAAPMTERMATPGGRGYAGGIFSRTLFSGL